MPSPRPWRTAVQALPLQYLVIPPILLAIATVFSLFLHSDVNAALLWSQCHSHARIPGLSRIPVLGTPLCYLVSFFHAALASLRTTAVMALILAFVGGLLTVSTVEAARVCNGPSVLIAYPTGPWLVFNLLGGAVVWQLVIIPAFLHRAKALIKARQDRETAGAESRGGGGAQDDSRHLPEAEVVAIPISVAIGYYLPSILMLVFNSPVTIGIWLFFPVYVSIIRQATRWAVKRVQQSERVNIHFESSWQSILVVYAIPAVGSVIAQVIFIWAMTLRDDRKEMTRSTIKFIQVDMIYMMLTVLYWMLAEVGWKVPLIMVATSVVVGPGAGTCLGWIYREKLIHQDCDGDEEAENESERRGDEPADEETPLLQ